VCETSYLSDCVGRLSIVPTHNCPQSVCNMFSVSPAAGTILASDKPVAVTVSVVPNKELAIKDQPILQCRVIEPRRTSLPADGSSPPVSVQSELNDGQTIANIPIRVSCYSSYSKYVYRTLLSLIQLIMLTSSNRNGSVIYKY